MPYTWRSIVWPLALGSSPVLWLLGHRMRGSHTGKFSSRQLTMLTYQIGHRYGRIETLSGFANGIFLILISIFIVFEAVQRM